MKNPKKFQKKSPRAPIVFSKVTGYKINTEKVILFIYICSEHLGNEIKTVVPFHTHKMGILGVNLTKQVKD